MCANEVDKVTFRSAVKVDETELKKVSTKSKKSDNAVVKTQVSTLGVGTEVQHNGAVSDKDENAPVVTNNLDEFIKSDSALKGYLFAAGLIDANNNLKKPVKEVAAEISKYYSEPSNMTHLRVTEENREEMLKQFDGLVEKTPEKDDPNSFKIIDKTGFVAKLKELKKAGIEISPDDGREMGVLTETTETPAEETAPQYGLVDPNYFDKIKSNFVKKFGAEQAEDMFSEWIKTNSKSGMITKIGDKFYSSKVNSGIPTIEAEDEDDKTAVRFLDIYDTNRADAKSALARTKYFKDISNVKASLSGMDASDTLNLTDDLGTRPIGKLDEEYYSVIITQANDGTYNTKPKYFDENDPQWQAYTKEQQKWEAEFAKIMSDDNAEGVVLTDEQLKTKHLMMKLQAYSNMTTRDASSRTKEEILGLSKPWEAMSDSAKQEVRDRNLQGVDISRLARIYAASQMKAEKSDDAANPHPAYEINYDKMAEKLVTDRFDHERSNVEVEFQVKLSQCKDAKEADKILNERLEKLEKIDAEEQKTEIQDREDYAILMTDGKLERDAGKAHFENTVPHWDSKSKNAAKGDGKNHTDIGKTGRKFVEGNGFKFAMKAEVTDKDDYDYSEKDKNTGKIHYYKIANSGKDDYDFVVNDANGKQVYCKFDGNEWKDYWSKQADTVSFGFDDDTNDFYLNLDEARNKAQSLLHAKGKESEKYDKHRYRSQVKDLAESAGLTSETDNTLGLQAAHILKGAAVGAAGAVGATVIGNLANQFSGIGYTAKAMAYLLFLTSRLFM